MKKLIFFIVLFFALVLTFCNPNDEDTNNSTENNLLASATTYAGTYPAAANVVFTESGTTSTVKAFPGQIIVFFKLPVTEADATGIITGTGGTVVAKIPAVGYYMATVTAENTTSFLNTLNSNSKVSFAVPNLVAELSNGVTVLDGCNSGFDASESHASKVASNITGCGGAVQVCQNFMADNKYVSTDKILDGILNAVKNNANGDILINLSAAAGFNDGSYFNRGSADQKTAQVSWYKFTRNVLKIISTLDSSYRERLVVTIATGNGNMPVTNLLAELRNNPAYASALANNVLFVSNKADSIIGTTGKGNYSATDRDVIVTDNTDGAQGTSFSAPCAMGMIQKVMTTKKVGPVEAMKAIKAVSMTNSGRLVNDSYLTNVYAVVDLIKSKTGYSASATTLFFGPYVSTSGKNTCYQNFYFDVLPTIYWNGSQGSMLLPTTYKRAFVPPSSGGCSMKGVTTSNNLITVSLTGNNSHLTGSGFAYFASGGADFKAVASFEGAVNIEGDITGTLIITEDPMLSGLAPASKTITFFKQ